MQLWRRHPWLLRMLALLLALVGVVLPLAWMPGLSEGLEDRVGDWAWRLGSRSTDEKRVVLVDIDEASLAEVGPWPWPRSKIAQLSDRLAAAGATVQAFDIAFPDPREGDDMLQAAWRHTPAVVAQVFSIDPAVTASVGRVSGALAAPGCPPFAPRAWGHYGLASTLLAAHTAVGHITPRVGPDGVVREIPALICDEGRAYSSLALATLLRSVQPEPGETRPAYTPPAPDWRWHTAAEASPYPPGLAPAAWLTSPSLPGIVVPLDPAGNLRVPYALARQAMTSVSAADVLEGRLDPALLQGALVIVGATAFGIGDTIATPMAAVASGLEVHLQTVVGLLDQRIPHTPVRWPLWQGLLFAVLAGVLALAARRRGGVHARQLPLIGAGLALLLLLAAAAALLKFALWLPWVSLAAFSLLASISLATVEHALVRAQRERLSAHLGAYLPAPVAQRLMATEPSGSLQLEPREICVLVAQVRNFTAFATHGEPSEVAALLHAYCCLAVEVIERHGGVVDNVVGDCIVALWAAQADSPHGCLQAMAAAQDLVRSLQPLLASRHPVSEVGAVQPLALGVGLESGPAIVGSFGPARRRAHAALGEPVSVANRIQQMTADLSIPVLLGPQLAASLPADQLEPLGDYLLEGLGKHYRLWAPVGWGELAYVDSNWATSAAGESSRSPDSGDWSRWSQSTLQHRSAPTWTADALAAIRRRSA